MTRAPSAHDVLDPATLQDPYPFYRRLRETAPVWRVPGTDVFFVSSYALVDEAARRVEDFSSHIRGVLYRGDNDTPAVLSYHAEGMDVLATADPPEHALHKNAIFPSLVATRMAQMEPEIAMLSAQAIESALQCDTIEFMSAIALRIPIEVVIKLVGFQGADRDALLQLALDSSAMVGGAMAVDDLLALIERNRETTAWLGEQLRTVRAAQDSILHACQQAVRDGVLNADEARGILHILLGAAGESTSSLIGNAVRVLAEDPELQGALRDDPTLIPALLEEVLRLEAPFRSHLRSAPAATTLGGVELPAGATLLLLWGAANRDPEVFDEPDRLDLDRPRRHLAFGRGIHTCVGAPLARVEAKAALAVLLARTTVFRISDGEQPRWAESLQMRRHAHLPIRIEAA